MQNLNMDDLNLQLAREHKGETVDVLCQVEKLHTELETETKRKKVKKLMEDLTMDDVNLKVTRNMRKRAIVGILCQVEELQKEIESETETKKKKVKKLLRDVKKLCKYESVKRTYYNSKPIDLGITDTAVRVYNFENAMLKLIFDRDSAHYNNYVAVQHFQVYVQMAINFFNKKKSTDYKVLELIRAFRSLSVSYVHTLYFTFSAKRDDDDDTPAKTFRTVIGLGMQYVRVFSVDIVEAPGILHPDILLL